MHQQHEEPDGRALLDLGPLVAVAHIVGDGLVELLRDRPDAVMDDPEPRGAGLEEWLTTDVGCLSLVASHHQRGDVGTFQGQSVDEPIIDQAEQSSERIGLAGMRRGREEQQVRRSVPFRLVKAAPPPTR